MSQPILTTQNTNKMSKLGAIISGILDVVFAIFMYGYFKEMQDKLQNRFLESAAGLIIGGVIVLAGLVIYTVYQFSICNSYVDVYADHIEGKGIQNVYQVVDFNLPVEKITAVTCSNIYLNIQTAGGKYKILTNAETAQKVYNYYNHTQK